MSTIFALASAPGRAGVSVMRVSGTAARDICSLLTKAPLPEPRRATLRTLYSPESGEVIDQALLLWFPTPHSFTGEDTLELHLHGSRAVIQALSRILLAQKNVRMAEPGEFSRRAFDNGKMDLTQAEGLADLIDAETELQRKQALRQVTGELEQLYSGWRVDILKILALLEAYIDFPDEDIPEDTAENVLKNVRVLLESLKKHCARQGGEIIRAGAHIAIIGAPNVGKSSLLNTLAQRDVAIVSDIAGTTRDVLEVTLDIGGCPVVFSDTAGLHNTEDDIELQGIQRAINRAKTADIIVCVLDATRPEESHNAIRQHITSDSIILVNKFDTPQNGEAPPPTLGALPISAKTGNGIDEFIQLLESKITSMITLGSEPMLTRERHRAGIEKASVRLEKFCLHFEQNVGIELCAEDLHLAARALGEIVGVIDVENVLDILFSEFCIGK